mgnify:CR=1 FL=1
MAAIANLKIDQGASFSSDVTVKDANGNAFNLTGYTVEAKMAKGELRDMLTNGSELYNMIQDGQELPGWVSAYITLASDYIHSVYEYKGVMNIVVFWEESGYRYLINDAEVIVGDNAEPLEEHDIEPEVIDYIYDPDGLSATDHGQAEWVKDPRHSEYLKLWDEEMLGTYE